MKNATGKNENRTQLLTKKFVVGYHSISRGGLIFFKGEGLMEKLNINEVLQKISHGLQALQKLFQIHSTIFPLASCPQFGRSAQYQLSKYRLDIRLDNRRI